MVPVINCISQYWSIYCFCSKSFGFFNLLLSSLWWFNPAYSCNMSDTYLNYFPVLVLSSSPSLSLSRSFLFITISFNWFLCVLKWFETTHMSTSTPFMSVLKSIYCELQTALRITCNSGTFYSIQWLLLVMLLCMYTVFNVNENVHSLGSELRVNIEWTFVF